MPYPSRWRTTRKFLNLRCQPTYPVAGGGARVRRARPSNALAPQRRPPCLQAQSRRQWRRQNRQISRQRRMTVRNHGTTLERSRRSPAWLSDTRAPAMMATVMTRSRDDGWLARGPRGYYLAFFEERRMSGRSPGVKRRRQDDHRESSSATERGGPGGRQSVRQGLSGVVEHSVYVARAAGRTGAGCAAPEPKGGKALRALPPEPQAARPYCSGF